MALTIAMLSRWNATCGVSIHAELTGREFVRMGHKLIVFAPTLESAGAWWHHRVVRGDEPWVVRCYEEIGPRGEGGKINEGVVLSRRFDILVVESYRSLPHAAVTRLLERLRGDVRTVLVVHNSGLDDTVRVPLELFDAVVVFDERYSREVLGGWNKRVRIIPFPCHPVMREKVERPRFAHGRFLFFSFGRQPAHEYFDYLLTLAEVRRKYELVYWVVRSNGLIPFQEQWIVQEQRRLEVGELYKCLHAADVHLLPKFKTRYVVVSSTLFLCLGSLCPTVVPDTRHFEMLPAGEASPVVKYRDRDDLVEKLLRLVEDREYRTRIVSAAEAFVRRNSARVIAEKFVSLFHELLS